MITNPTNEHPNRALEELIARNREQATLLPCPFDGAEAILYPILGPSERSSYGYYVGCSGADCLCALGEGYDRDAMPEHSFTEPETAIEAWNTRPSLSSRDAEIREVLEGLSYFVTFSDGKKVRHWCAGHEACSPACKAAAALYAKTGNLTTDTNAA